MKKEFILKRPNKRIYWIQVPFSKKYGGFAYSEIAKKALSKEFDLKTIEIEEKYLKNRYLKLFEWFFRALMLKKQEGLVVIDNTCSIIPVNLAKKARAGSIALVHHIDYKGPIILRPGFFVLEKIFLRNMKKADTMVVVSEYWKRYFLERGQKKVVKIYNSIDMPYEIGQEEILEFKKRFNLKEKPIVYIGNCQKAKGVIEVYNALKDLDVYLVTSGKRRVDIPVLNLELEFKDYIRLLKASSIVVTMSKFKEGWCRTAAEAMICKRPVIGSGLGGMKELLQGGGQIICSFGDLRKKVEYLLNNPEIRKTIGGKGYRFVKEFTFDKFEKSWLNLISQR